MHALVLRQLELRVLAAAIEGMEPGRGLARKHRGGLPRRARALLRTDERHAPISTTRQLLMAPASPERNLRWKITYTISTGAIEIRMPAFSNVN